MANRDYYRHRLLGIDGKEMVDVETLAPILGLCEEQVRRLTRENSIPAIKNGRRWWYHVDTVLAKRTKTVSTLSEAAKATGL